MPIQTMPETSESTTVARTPIRGSARKSLNPMATNCLSITAIQKIGSEKNRNETNVDV